MLDLVAVAGQVRRMGAGLRALDQERAPRLAQALQAWEHAAAMGPDLRDRIARAKTSWLVAEPLEPLGAYDVHPRGDYRVVASDGSQILPDRHDHFPAYLTNVGVVDISYSSGSVQMASSPHLCWEPDDVYPMFGGQRQEADGRVVAARRFTAECDALTAAASAPPSEEPLILLTDGTLLLWWLDTDAQRLASLDPGDVKAEALRSLRELLTAAASGRGLLAGFLSAPRSRDVVSMLKVVMCTEEPVDCDHCPYETGDKSWHAQLELAGTSILPVPSKPCEEADPIVDAALLRSLLEPGQRSARFRSAAPISAAYDAPIDFFYLHTGAEIARVELPATTPPDGLDRLAGTVLDQCHKGMGYPVALAEAHEQAVVKAPDRRAFNELVRRQGVSGPSAKLARKRTGVL
jgi:hypothetical protein